MLNPQVTRLLEAAIDTSCKLAIVLQFMEHQTLCLTPAEMAARVCRDIWSVEAAVKELAEDGVVSMQDKRYRYTPAPELARQLRLLNTTYTHPLERNELNVVLRNLERLAPYRRAMQQHYTILN